MTGAGKGNQRPGFRDTPEARHVEVIVRGPPGAGKTTLSCFLADLLHGWGVETKAQQRGHDSSIRTLPPELCAAITEDVLDEKVMLDANVTVIDEQASEGHMPYKQFIELSRHVDGLLNMVKAGARAQQATNADYLDAVLDSALKAWLEIFPDSPLKKIKGIA